VADLASATVTPVSTATGRPGKAIRVGGGIDAIAITPNGKTAFVVDVATCTSPESSGPARHDG
jgi:hypothetical protein